MRIFVLCYLFYLSLGHAEYRVYQYLVKNNDSFQEKDISYEVLSTLNPVSYKAYHGGQETIQIDLLRTWLCPGHTGGRKEYCESPYAKLLSESPQ